jgi:hypothetical protein
VSPPVQLCWSKALISYPLSRAKKVHRLATGAFYSQRDHPRIDERPSDFFAARTRIFLEIEMDSPTLATIQAAMILSAHEAADGRDSRAWIYSGMAVQMATDLGLHLNIELDGKYLDVVTEIEQVMALRKNIFWVVYTSNTYVYLSFSSSALPKQLISAKYDTSS